MSEKKAKKKRAEEKKKNEIKLTYRVFANIILQDNRSTNFFKIGLSKINFSDLPMALAIDVDELIEEIENKRKVFERMRTKLLEKYKPKDSKEKDSFPKEKEEELNKEFEELLNQEFIIKCITEKIILPRKGLTIEPVHWRPIKPLFQLAEKEENTPDP